MPYPELGVHYGLAVKVETTRGVWAAPAMATDAIPLAKEPTVTYGYELRGDREGAAVGGLGAPSSAAPLGRSARVRFTTELMGSGTATTPPRWARLLRPFMTETVGVSDVSYVPSSAAAATLSVLVEWAGKSFQIVGAVPESLVIRGAADSPRVLIECTLAGKLNAAPSELALEAQSFQANTPTPFQGALTVAGTALKYQEFELDFGLRARPWRVDRNVSDPLLFGVVTQVDPRITFPVEVEALGTFDPFSIQAVPGTARAFSQRLGTTSGNRFLITGDFVEILGDPFELSSQDGIMYYNLSFRFAKPASGTWFKISHD